MINQIDWGAIDLVVFDVDGTLYRQRPLRLRMAAELLRDAARRRTLSTIIALKLYRNTHEAFCESDDGMFEERVRDHVATTLRISPAHLSSIITEWIEHRPLRHVARYRYAGIETLFRGLKRHGKQIGVLSDYPASAKLAALGLCADHVRCAQDVDVGLPKPHPRGMRRLIELANVTPERALIIGDRPERDGRAARSAGAKVLIRSPRLATTWQTFRDYNDTIFSAVSGPANPSLSGS
jgi:putative hydrolase of the HAD superfamily